MAQVSPSQKEVRADPQLRSIVDPAWKQRTLGEDSHAQSSLLKEIVVRHSCLSTLCPAQPCCGHRSAWLLSADLGWGCLAARETKGS